SGGWSASAHAARVDLLAAAKLMSPWLSLPADYTFSGHLDAQVEAHGRDRLGEAGAFQASTRDLNFTNQDGSVVGEKIVASLSAQASRQHGRFGGELQLHSTMGQALAGPVLLDFAANPLELHARGGLGPDHAAPTLDISELTVKQKDLLE